MDDTTIDHVYEEVRTLDESDKIYEILNHQSVEDKYRVLDSFVNNIFLPSHKICSQCAYGSRGSPVIYSDTLIRCKRNLYAREAIFLCPEISSSQLYFQFYSISHFDRESPFNDRQDFMPVLNLMKTHQSGILYSRSILNDVFDLRSNLEPRITLLGNEVKKIGEINTQIYHRAVNFLYSRISKFGYPPSMIIPRIKSTRIFSSVKSTDYDENTSYWFNYDCDMKKQHDEKETRDEQHISAISEAHNNNRSSLLLLEPLLLMPELASPRQKSAKNRITHSEHVKIVRMVIAYTLSFFLLAIITFYIVYFT